MYTFIKYTNMHAHILCTSTCMSDTNVEAHCSKWHMLEGLPTSRHTHLIITEYTHNKTWAEKCQLWWLRWQGQIRHDTSMFPDSPPPMTRTRTVRNEQTLACQTTGSEIPQFNIWFAILGVVSLGLVSELGGCMVLKINLGTKNVFIVAIMLTITRNEPWHLGWICRIDLYDNWILDISNGNNMFAVKKSDIVYYL